MRRARLAGRRGSRRFAVAGALLVALVASVALTGSGALDGLEDRSVALRFQARHHSPPTDVAVVAVDSRTLQALDRQWPYPRSWHGTVIDRLRRAGAAVIVADIQFTEPTSTREDDALFAAVRRAGNVVLATTEPDARGRTRIFGGDEQVRAARALAGSGNQVTGRDGVISHVPYQTSRLRSLAVVAAARAGRPVRAADFPGGDAWIDFQGAPGTVLTLSYADVMRGTADLRALRGRVVVLGATAPTLGDVHATPISDRSLMSGPEIQAAAIHTLLAGVPLHSAPGWVLWAAVAGALLLPALCAAFGRGWRSVLPVPLAGVLMVGGAEVLFEHGWVVPLAAPVATLLIAGLSAVAAAYVSEYRERVRVAVHNDELERLVDERTAELRDTQLEIVSRLGRAAEWRDGDLGDHIERISHLCRRLALAAGMGDARAEMIARASVMHDVGKIGVPDRVLLKPGRLDAEEWELMRRHTTMGASILAGSSSPLLQTAETIARHHHERWDGTGYPAGLSGTAIPIEARICAIADVFDALRSSRPYKSSWSAEVAREKILRERGAHFDPELADLFIALIGEFERDLPAADAGATPAEVPATGAAATMAAPCPPPAPPVPPAPSAPSAAPSGAVSG